MTTETIIQQNTGRTDLDSSLRIPSADRSRSYTPARSTFVADPLKEICSLLPDLSREQKENFNKLSSSEKADFIRLATDLLKNKDIGSSELKELSQAVKNLLCLKTSDGALALTSLDRRGSDSLLNHLIDLAEKPAEASSNKQISDKRSQILANFIKELSGTIEQGNTAFCVPFSVLEVAYLSEPAEVARQLKEAVITGKIETNKPDSSGGYITIDASSAGLNPDLRKGASLSACLIACSYMQYSGITETGMTRSQSEHFMELFSGACTLQAISSTQAAHELSTEERLKIAVPLINERIADKDENGKMKEFFVSMQWLMQDSNSPNRTHAYHNLAVVDYDSKSERFIALNPWPAEYELPEALMKEYGIKKLGGEAGEKGYISIPKESMAKLMNWVAVNTGKAEDLGLSADALSSAIETTFSGDFDFNMLMKIINSRNKSNQQNQNK